MLKYNHKIDENQFFFNFYRIIKFKFKYNTLLPNGLCALHVDQI